MNTTPAFASASQAVEVACAALRIFIFVPYPGRAKRYLRATRLTATHFALKL